MSPSARRLGALFTTLAVGLAVATTVPLGGPSATAPVASETRSGATQVTARASATTSSTASATAAARPGAKHVLRATILSRDVGPRVTVVVREHDQGRVVQTRRKKTRLDPDQSTKVRMAVRTTRSRPNFSVRLAVPPLRPGAGVALSAVSWNKGKPAQESPEPPAPDDPGPVNPGPDPDPEPPSGPGADTLSNGCAYTPRGLPKCGAYLGQTFGSNTSPADFERDFGRRLGIRRTFFTASQVDSAVRIAGEDLRAGRLPWVSFKLPESWTAMASGAGDAWARDLARKLGALDGPVWVAFHHEPEGDGDIQAWRAMQERLAPIVRAESNLAFSVIVTGYHQFYGDAQYSLDNIWPRGVKVDIAGFDIYNQLGVVKDGKENVKGTDLDEAYFSQIEPWAEKQGVAWGLAETGITHRGAEQDPSWIRRTYRQLEAAGGSAFTYFNTTLNSVAPWDLSTATKRAGWREAQAGSPLVPRG